MDGKPATATHFSLNPGNSSKATPIAPVAVDPNTKWDKSYVAIQAKEDAQVGAKQKAVVTYVEDGDTVNLNRKGTGNINCRIDTIDAPEKGKPFKTNPEAKAGQAYGNEAGKTLQSMIDKKEVTLIVTKAPTVDPSVPKTPENNYGRALCKIEIQGANIDTKLIQAGAAWVYRKYGTGPVNPALVPLEQKAKANKVGLWEDPTAEDPKDFRKRTKQ